MSEHLYLEKQQDFFSIVCIHWNWLILQKFNLEIDISYLKKSGIFCGVSSLALCHYPCENLV
jgi:hypothetical protein